MKGKTTKEKSDVKVTLIKSEETNYDTVGVVT